MIVIAHRGANREAQENSMAAFEKAVEGGATRIELDVHRTYDGHIAILHDDELFKMTGVHGRISRRTRQELTRIKLHNGESVPFLDDVMERFLGRVELNIEIKGSSTVLADLVGRACINHKHREKIIVSCFSPEPLVHLREKYGEIKRACLWGIFDNLRWPNFAHSAPPIFMQMAGTNVLHPQLDLIDEDLMDQAQARGWVVNGWAPMAGEEHDREGIWTTLHTLGVHGFCTNYPRQLKTWLDDAKRGFV